MNPFQYERARDAAGAIHAVSPRSKFLAGGTNLIHLMKNGIEKPEMLIDLNRGAVRAASESTSSASRSKEVRQ
jgi:xanthine dehydrogenase YagS FAD-binding subunit